MYLSIDNAIQKILQYGKGTMLTKIDIQSAFYLMPVHPEDHHLLTVSGKGQVYIDHCIPFGVRSAPKSFNTLADLLSWAAQKAGVSYLIHYLDDYLTMGPPLSKKYANAMWTSSHHYAKVLASLWQQINWKAQQNLCLSLVSYSTPVVWRSDCQQISSPGCERW